MAQTPPPAMTAAPTPYPVRNDRTTFSARVDGFVTWLVTAVAQFAAAMNNVYDNAVDCYNNALIAVAQAASAVAAANATIWVSGTTYAIGDARYSPVNMRTYKRLTVGAGTTDPSADATNWRLVTADYWVRKTSAYTAAAFDNIKASTAGGAWSLTAPASPSDGDSFRVLDIDGTFHTGNLSILQNGAATIMGYTTFILDTRYLDIAFTYDSTLADWRF